MENRKKWSFWRKLKWKVKAFKHVGLIALLLPYPEVGYAHPLLGAFYTATTPLLALLEEERKKAPFLEEVYLISSDFVEPYLYGDERAEKKGDLKRVYSEAEKFFDYLKGLEQREPFASWLLREIISSYLTDVSTAFDLLYEVEKDKEFQKLGKFFRHLMFAIGDLDEEELNEAKELIKT
ncbi:MAG: hypothetical protein JHC26_09955 [Thermofilum sp.]|jgi:hypothetical protein|uniref:hypothetical protein n=1 Tax=Thermofilum sp. TaxID=1961369 RepID=UPI002587C25F|nr:hypothetical protein [Thermofilum sp.]MCI4409406.1 hypothetical protein [Thermofilum sp.]